MLSLILDEVSHGKISRTMLLDEDIRGTVYFMKDNTHETA